MSCSSCYTIEFAICKYIGALERGVSLTLILVHLIIIFGKVILVMKHNTKHVLFLSFGTSLPT